MKEILEKVYSDSLDSYYKYLDYLLIHNKKKFIVTVNPEIIMQSYKSKEIKEILLNKKNSLTPDGISIIKKAKKYRININERITGVDITSELLKLCNEQGKSIFLFGASEEVINGLVKKVKVNYKNIKILGYSNGYVKDKDLIFENIKKLNPDVTLVALGVPYQELLINKHIKDFKKGIFVGVGGTFDVLSGIKKRAPKFFIKHNLEWLYRIIKEPKRILRFVKYNIVFMLKK